MSAITNSRARGEIGGRLRPNSPGSTHLGEMARKRERASVGYGFKRLEAISPSLITQYRELQIKSDPRARDLTPHPSYPPSVLQMRESVNCLGARLLSGVCADARYRREIERRNFRNGLAIISPATNIWQSVQGAHDSLTTSRSVRRSIRTLNSNKVFGLIVRIASECDRYDC